KRFDKSGSWEYDIEMPGFKYNMTDVQAAIGTHQLRKLAGFHARRREVVAAYNEAFGTNPGLQVPIERPDSMSAWHLYVLRVRPELLGMGRNAIIDEHKARNIDISHHCHTMNRMSYYAKKYSYQPYHYPDSYVAYQRVLSMPI